MMIDGFNLSLETGTSMGTVYKVQKEKLERERAQITSQNSNRVRKTVIILHYYY